MSSLHITLVRPPYVIPKTSIFGHRGTPALGLAYLSGIAHKMGCEVDAVDAFAKGMEQFSPIPGTELLTNGITNEEAVDLISEKTDLIGITCMFSSEWINTSKFIKLVRKKFPNTVIVLGGEHVTADHEYILKNYPEVNLCILGEGEHKFANLIDQLKNNPSAIFETPGVTYFDSSQNTVVTTSNEYRVKNIDDIPFPVWKGLEIKEFHDRKLGMSMIGNVTMPMIISRGCPYQCTFCSSANMWTTRWIPRDIDEIIREIRYYKDVYNINHLDFFDLTAVVNKKWTIEFCERVIEEDLGVTWSLPSGTRSEALTKEVLTLLKKSGCNKLTYAPETGSARMSKLIKKRTNLKKMLASMKNAVDLGIIVKSNIIFGFPDEKFSDRIMNFVFMSKMAWVGVHDVPCFGFTPYPGSELFDRLIKEGAIEKDDNYYEFMAELVYTKPFNNKSWNAEVSNNIIPCLTLGGMAFFYSLQFLFRPKRFFSFVKNVFNNTPQTMLEIAFSNMHKDFWNKGRFKEKKKILENAEPSQKIFLE